MKRILIMLMLPVAIALYSCGNETIDSNDAQGAESGTEAGTETTTDGTEAGTGAEDARPDEEKAADMTEAIAEVAKMDGMDLSEHGYDLIVKSPSGAISELMSWGAVEIRSGDRFKLSISKGGNGIADKKLDLESDLVYKVNYLAEDGNAIMYSQGNEEAQIPTVYHLFAEVKVGSDVYEIIDLDGNEFSLEEIQAMYEVAKTIAPKEAS